ncbi:hypothetical protein LZD49_12585 [Dyadobacter sp. CY261]|uniref:hypothetical protein n=1 Tax=Dyadobacter sp. CY261 TaxID=2907203 RepID=UPI001F234A14|nr:hypothetical protein [Dyadobacter sp. CY261]MCF0071310.1 hypothetical protein [Dyadobacter sp. CY261]
MRRDEGKCSTNAGVIQLECSQKPDVLVISDCSHYLPFHKFHEGVRAKGNARQLFPRIHEFKKKLIIGYIIYAEVILREGRSFFLKSLNMYQSFGICFKRFKIWIRIVLNGHI